MRKVLGLTVAANVTVLSLTFLLSYYCFIELSLLIIGNKHPFLILIHFLRRYLTLYLLIGFYYFYTKKKLSKLQFIFNWKIWAVPALIIIALSLLMMVHNPFGKIIIGYYRWYYVGPLTYASLFLSQNFLWQKTSLDAYTCWMLSGMACYLVSYLYEVPHFLLFYGEIPYWQFHASLLGFFIILLILKWRPTKLFYLSVLFLGFYYIITFLNPTFDSYFWVNFFWLARLASAPMFYSILLSFKKVKANV